MDFAKLNNEQIYLMVRNRILSSCYWRKRLFSTISGYKDSELKMVARHTKKINGHLEAKLEDLKLSSFALPYLAKGKPIQTNSKKERKVLISFFYFVVSENKKNYEEKATPPKKLLKSKPAHKVPKEPDPMPVESKKKKPIRRYKKSSGVNMSLSEMENIVNELKAVEMEMESQEYKEKKTKAFEVIEKAKAQGGILALSLILETAEMVKGLDRLKLLKMAKPLLKDEDKKAVAIQITNVDERIKLESLAKFRLEHKIII